MLPRELMLRLLLLCFCALSALPSRAAAPPLTIKDLALMARTGYSETEILSEAEKRKLAANVDPAMEAALASSGLPARLIARLKEERFRISPEQQATLSRPQTAQRLAMEQREQAEAALQDQRRREAAASAESAGARDNVVHLLEGKLVHLQASELRPYATSNLRNVRLFAFYYATNWTAECRAATAAVLEWYARVKPEHPDFELIFVSRDRSEMTMRDHVRKYPMPFPAVRFDALGDAGIQQFGGGTMPFLAAVSRAGSMLNKTAGSRYIGAPAEVLPGIEFLLAELRKPNAKLKGE